MTMLFERADQAIQECDPEAKADLAVTLRADWETGQVVREDVGEPAPIGEPGRPSRPQLVAPRDLVQRRLSSREGRAALIHAIAHIEFNAMNLALDAVYRFRAMPHAYYGDWLRVAAEEASHFRMLRDRLRQMDYDYGDFPAHNGLWEMCIDTAHDVLVRMALVPRVLEARGLDVTPGMIERLQGAGDGDTVTILRRILAEEEGHVAIGSHWFRDCCAQRGLEPEATFRELLQRYMRGRLRGPFNRPARLMAGFSEAEMNALEQLDGP